MLRGTDKIELTPNKILRRDPNQEYAIVDNEIIMLSQNNGEYYALNGTASRIWEIISNPMNVTSIVEILLKEYVVSKEECFKDTYNCLSDLVEKGLILQGGNID